MPGEVSGIGIIFLIGLPELFHDRAFLHLVKDRFGLLHLQERPALFRGGGKCIPQHRRGEAFSIKMLEDMYIVKSLMRVLVTFRLMTVSSFSASTVSRL